MTIKLNVSKNQQVVVPIRFDRACRGAPQRLVAFQRQGHIGENQTLSLGIEDVDD